MPRLRAEGPDAPPTPARVPRLGTTGAGTTGAGTVGAGTTGAGTTGVGTTGAVDGTAVAFGLSGCTVSALVRLGSASQAMPSSGPWSSSSR
ncbi:hypothetical protein EF909_00595 [Streptomyces sp. WAC01280]|nr:hypothetical protein EF909_00595 [Streptomyces sp. WAC01280]